ncbi:zinc finger protein 182-like [Topomyia yanbarensis]|uniref:zinc finger protein 182-like n=1 Tax=Topomyia yanbarensis TaxID=2498891 RepID=UPI00273C8A18|nr:zinc finger protein 182-like [Topomyia yanbarensis]
MSAEICRICRKLKTDAASFVSLFSNRDTDEGSLADMFEIVAGVSASPEDTNMPQEICLDCSKQLEISFEFCKLCVESDKFLRSQCSSEIIVLDDDKPIQLSEEQSQPGQSIESTSVYLSDYDVSFYQIILDRYFYMVLVFVAHRCCGCHQAFASVDELRVHSQHDHKQNCTILSDHQCPRCFMCFSSADALSYHRQSVQDHLFCCRECYLLFEQKHTLFDHLRQYHYRVQDDLEKEFYNMEDQMIDHSIFEPESNLVVSHVQSLAEIDTSVDPYTLGFCELSADLKLSHLKTSQYKVAERNDGFSIIDFTWHRCCACNHMFSSQAELDIHCTEEHRNPFGPPQIEGKPFICRQCWRGFKRKSLLSLHQKFNRKKVYACNVCLRVYFGRPAYEKHIPGCSTEQNDPGAVKPVQLTAATDDFTVTGARLEEVKEESDDDVYILND